MKKVINPQVLISCHFCGAYLHFEVVIDTIKVWSIRVHPCKECNHGKT